MLALADQFPEWKDFPKGLHVMLVDQDEDVIKDVKSKLNSCGYLVTCYRRGEDALQELEDRSKVFHVVVVDATRNETFDGFKIVAAAKHLTTIMMASTENMNIMMQGIAAGASEFLQKPLSEERLKNLWQHVVRKALVAGHLVAPTITAPPPKDLKCQTTSKPASACSDLTDGGEMPSKVKHEDEVSCIYDVEKGTDEAGDISATQQFFFEVDSHHGVHSQSSYLHMDGKDNCDAFLCSTPPQLEQSYTRIVHTDHDDNPEFVSSPPMSVSQDFSMKEELKDMHEYFDDCDNYLHIRSEVEEAVNNSTILNELFDSKSQMDADNFLLMGDDQNIENAEFADSKLCSDLELDNIPDSLDDIALGADILDDTTDQSLSMGLDQCLEDEDFQEADEEALLLAEVAEAEKDMQLGNPHCSGGATNNSVNDDLPNMHRSRNTSSDAFPGSGRKPLEANEETRCRSDSEQSCNTKGNKSSGGKKKMKVDWTPDLHRRFVQAVEQLGVDKAIPSRILELMDVKCLTRHNIASHLQKYRSHRKHVHAREVESTSWNQRRTMEAAAHGHAATPSAMLLPHQAAAWPSTPRPSAQTQSRTSLSAAPAPTLHVWGHPSLDPTLHFWPAWPPPGCQVDAWGNAFYPAQPILRVPLAPMPSVANMAMPRAGAKLANLHPPKETVAAAISEVLRNPYTPLPLGLKSPSLESVVVELQRQGIPLASTVVV